MIDTLILTLKDAIEYLEKQRDCVSNLEFDQTRKVEKFRMHNKFVGAGLKPGGLQVMYGVQHYTKGSFVKIRILQNRSNNVESKPTGE